MLVYINFIWFPSTHTIGSKVQSFLSNSGAFQLIRTSAWKGRNVAAEWNTWNQQPKTVLSNVQPSNVETCKRTWC